MNGQLEEAMAHQLGWVLYLSCPAIAVGWRFLCLRPWVQSGGVTEMAAAVTREPFAFQFGLAFRCSFSTDWSSILIRPPTSEGGCLAY
jgi:hypothetical protein